MLQKPAENSRILQGRAFQIAHFSDHDYDLIVFFSAQVLKDRLQCRETLVSVGPQVNVMRFEWHRFALLINTELSCCRKARTTKPLQKTGWICLKLPVLSKSFGT